MSVLRSFLRSSGCRSLLFKPAGFPCSLQIRASLAVQSLGAETVEEAVPSGTLDRDADSSSVSTLEREAAETTGGDLEQAADASSSAAALDARVLREEVAKRRNFAIISHPDAGKTTLTEKLLLFGGAIHEAGEVKARRASKHATSDWMEIEKQRGISITSTALTFQFGEMLMNLLDTPGHQDFSEDTYRTLAAADNAVMLVDGAKGIEPQTRKLFEVVRMRNLPIFTFVNKLDRPALDPLEILDQLDAEFGLKSYPINWPIGSGDRFVGVYHRPTKQVHLFERTTQKARAKGIKGTIFAIDDPALLTLIEPDLWAQVQEEIELLDEVGEVLDMEAVMSGALTPIYFGSAMSTFGVELFLNSFVSLAAAPGPHETLAGEEVAPVDEHFSGLVFKLQANMDPRHRDKVAFVRVCSGKFEKGMKVNIARTGKTVALSRPQKMFAQDRATVQEGFAGDVIGLNNPGAFAIGDTLYSTGTPAVVYPPIPSFSPELFAYLKCPPGHRKAFRKGLDGLLGEGAVQVLTSTDSFRQDPVLAAVGALQFEVVQHRMRAEYGVETTLDPLPYSVARWVLGGWENVEKAGRLFNSTVMKDVWGQPVLLFRNEFALQQAVADGEKTLGKLSPFCIPPNTS